MTILSVVHAPELPDKDAAVQEAVQSIETLKQALRMAAQPEDKCATATGVGGRWQN